ncbi:MAG: HDOD domain-containing protein [Rhodocyclaceae bacterium]|nr:MAG: HDOD domain-containing protein [Rhodocyclaceae bacterium]
MSAPSIDQAILERLPIIDRHGDTFAYELRYAHKGDGRNDDAPPCDLEAASTVLAHVIGSLEGDSASGKPVFINVHLSLLTDEDFLALLPAGKVVLILHGTADLVTDQVLATCEALRRHNIGLCMDGWALGSTCPELMIRSQYVKLDVLGHDGFDLYNHYTGLADYPAKKIARQVSQSKEYRFCHGIGFDLFQGYFFTHPEAVSQKEVNTSVAQLVQLFELVGNNAEAKDLEAVFKRDPALVVKLLGYINSAGMGVGRKVTSIHQAIVLLGYKQLYRWVALLLYTSGSNAAPAALMKTVLARSRFIELLGRPLLPKHEQDNLFMVGMLSMLDVVFGQPLDQALARLPLPDSIIRAILDRDGILGRLLSLAEAVEQGDLEEIDALVAELRLSATQPDASPAQILNRLQMEAVNWAESLAL